MNNAHALKLCVFAVAWFPALAGAFVYSASDGKGGFLTNQTEGAPIVWRQNSAEIRLNFTSAFSTSAEVALNDWNALGTRFQWQVGSKPATPCNRSDRKNAAGWRATTCDGLEYGDALAITTRTYEIDGTAVYHVDTDIIFDNKRKWSAYLPGALTPDGQGGVQFYDFRRVMRHELGHALGLDHPDEANPPQQVTAIMNSTSSDIEFLQDDDKLGAITIYAFTQPINTPAPAPAPTSNPPPSNAGGGGGGAELSWAVLLLMAWKKGRRNGGLKRATLKRGPLFN